MDIIFSINDCVLSLVRGKENDIYAIKYLSFYTHYLTITYLNGKKLGFSDIDLCLSSFCSLGLIPDSLVSFYKEKKDIFDRYFENIEEILPSNFNVGRIREQLLAQELIIDGGEAKYKEGKFSRDATGSYYTPAPLARATIEEAIRWKVHLCSTKEEEKIVLGQSNVIDPSCGVGDFLEIYLEVLQEKYGLSPEYSVLNVWGIDLDPLALQVAACSMLSKTSEKNWTEVISHFILGNPLVSGDGLGSFEQKIENYYLGLLYSPAMSISLRGLNFDIVIGNPPWEKIRFEQKKFLLSYNDNLSVNLRSDRDNVLKKYEENNPSLFKLSVEIAESYNTFKKSVASNDMLHFSLLGELNTYVLFSELALNMLKESGVSSLILKAAIVTTPAYKELFSAIVDGNNIYSINIFENKRKIFAIDSREKFCILTMGKDGYGWFEFRAGLECAEDLRSKDKIILTKKDIDTINPISKMIPNVIATKDMQTLIDSHNNLNLFGSEFPDCHYGRLLHLTAQAEYIEYNKTEDNLPILEGKLINCYDSRYSTYRGVEFEQRYKSKSHANVISSNGTWPKEKPEYRYYVKKELWQKYLERYPEKYTLCWRSLTSSTNRRTTIATIIPTMPTCQSLQILQLSDYSKLLFLLGLFNTQVFDSYVRIKMPGIDLTQSVIKQVPVPGMHILLSSYENGISYYDYVIEKVKRILSFEPELADLTGEKTTEYQDPNIILDEIESCKKDIEIAIRRAYDVALNL